MSPVEQLKKWPHGLSVFYDWLGKGGQIVVQEKAEMRARTCLQCPMHDPKTPLGRSVAKAVNQILGVLNAVNLTLRMDVKPNQCTACGCDLRTKVWEPIDQVLKHSTAEDMERYWERCWIKKETE